MRMDNHFSGKNEYISYLEMISKIKRIKRGDVIYLISNVARIIKLAADHGEKFDPNKFIDTILDRIGSEGTLLIPTFNWDFCKGTTFDYYKTASRTGILGNAAIKRADFVRTMHPIYSCAVWGKDSGHILGLDTTNAFGGGTVFDYLSKVNAKALVLELNPSVGMTFFHHVEQKTGVPYRYIKTFSGSVIDRNGNKKDVQCSLYVKDLDLNPTALTDYAAVNRILADLNISQTQYINGMPVSTVLIAETEPIVRADILYNDSRNLYSYQGQKEGLMDE